MNPPNLAIPAFIFFLLCTIASAQSPAPAPAPPGPTNVTAVLEKAGRFTTFIRLLQNTKVADQINTQLNNSNQGMTIFAPTDSAFSSLKPGMLNSFTDEQKVELMQFHVLPSFFSTSQFQTASNPLRTQAGGSQGSFPMNVTATGNNLNITTGVTNATVGNTVYTDNQLAVYEVDRVLLPLSFFQSPAPAPAPSKPKKAAESALSPSDSDSSTPDDSSTANYLSKHGVGAMACAGLVFATFRRTL
ncbi:fasciclin-like arabinogalactan protein 11 [Andrographis paniculata]|uniref:fasciclin-like arabinogalactan protein 11 n=1 Tax=Andrographis paniculata TaxID=175694 RepID=UPI0021E9896A|nr:fasciclin-like arabinogalactan protein 11 [Andrographis paniculata]